MTAKTVKNPAASVRARLLLHAKQHGDNFQRILTRYAIERLLFRISQTEGSEHYVLKGAMLFVTWPDHVFRPTGDLDLLGHGDPDPAAILELFTGICQVAAPEDGIVFDPATLNVEPAREADKYQGARLRLIGELDGAKIRVLVDIGFGDHVYPPPERAAFPGLLPGLPSAKVLMYPPETVIAEKLEAIDPLWGVERPAQGLPRHLGHHAHLPLRPGHGHRGGGRNVSQARDRHSHRNTRRTDRGVRQDR
jgi:Nucleotidyl transferase AbiEii toxin, Type IV TA system